MRPGWLSYTQAPHAYAQRKANYERPSRTYSLPNSSDTYPPDYSQYNIITSSSTPPHPATIYSGVEPLAALKAYELAKHFDNTSIPETSALLSDRTDLYTRQLVNRYQQELDVGTEKSVEYYNMRYAPKRR